MIGNSEEMFVIIMILYEIIHEAHITTGYGGRNRIVYAVNIKYKNINIEAINIYLKLCVMKNIVWPKKVYLLNP